MFVDFARNYYVPSVTETTSRGERTYDLYSRLLKENIIIGKLIPAGTGFITHRNFELVETERPAGRGAEQEEEALQA